MTDKCLYCKAQTLQTNYFFCHIYVSRIHQLPVVVSCILEFDSFVLVNLSVVSNTVFELKSDADQYSSHFETPHLVLSCV